jgi:antitoxin component of RelBE/YafQ-DinJ toxin-antitoxin module
MAEYIEMRCEPAEKEAFRAAAEASGMGLSAWIRLTLRKAAKKPVAFLDRLSA